MRSNHHHINLAPDDSVTAEVEVLGLVLRFLAEDSTSATYVDFRGTDEQLEDLLGQLADLRGRVAGAESVEVQG